MAVKQCCCSHSCAHCKQAHLLAAVGHRDGAASLDAVEEPLLHGVVVEGPVDVDRAYTGEVDALVCQQLLSIQLALQYALVCVIVQA